MPNLASRHLPSPPQLRSGFSLIEAAIVLGVVGLVIGGIWVAATAVQQKMALNQTVELVNRSVDEIRKTEKPRRTVTPSQTLPVTSAQRWRRVVSSKGSPPSRKPAALMVAIQLNSPFA